MIYFTLSVILYKLQWQRKHCQTKCRILKFQILCDTINLLTFSKFLFALAASNQILSLQIAYVYFMFLLKITNYKFAISLTTANLQMQGLHVAIT